MTDSQKWFLLTVLLVTGLLIYLLGPVFTPFMIAGILAYIGTPLVERLLKSKLPRGLAVFAVFAFLFGLVAGLIALIVPLLEQQVGYLIKSIPTLVDQINKHVLPEVSRLLGIDAGQLSSADLQKLFLKSWNEAGHSLLRLTGMAGQTGLALIALVMNLILVPVITYYLLRDWPGVVSRLHSLVPRNQEKTVVELAQQSDKVLGAFLRGQLSIMIILAAVYAIGLSIVGIKLGFLIGVIAGLLSFVPYLGVIIGFILAALALLGQGPEWMMLVYIAIVFGVGQLLEAFILTPWLIGDRIGLHPVAVIFAILAGGQLFGFVGILLALPVAAVVAVILRFLHRQYLQSDLYKEGST